MKTKQSEQDGVGSRMEEVHTVEGFDVTDVKCKGILILYQYSVYVDIYCI